MTASYRSALASPGGTALTSAALVLRLPHAMYPLAIVLFVSIRTGEYGMAGALSGVYALSGGLAGPWSGALVDRHGQTRVLLPALALHVAGVIAVLGLGLYGAPAWALIAPVAVMGATYLKAAALVRARWAHLLGGRPELAAAYSWESALDDAVFIVGPLIVTTLALADPALAIAAGCVLVTAGSVLLRAQRASDPPPRVKGEARGPSPIRLPVLRGVVVSMVGIGGVFGSIEVVMVAVADEKGHRGATGVLLMLLGVSSLAAALAYGSHSWAAPLPLRFAVQGVLFAAAQPLLLASGSLAVIALAGCVVGLGIAPVLITAYALVERTVPPVSLTEGFSWAGTGIFLGFAGGAASAGLVIDHAGARPGFAVCVACGVLIALASTWTWRVRPCAHAD